MGKLKEDIVILNKDKVYSSYYARACKIVPNRRLVAISIGIPDNFGGTILRELNPPQQLLYDYKNGLCNEEEYIYRYYSSVLSKLNPIEIYNKLKGKVILCYCGKDKFCHRHIVMNWLIKEVGANYVGHEI